MSKVNTALYSLEGFLKRKKGGREEVKEEGLAGRKEGEKKITCHRAFPLVRFYTSL